MELKKDEQQQTSELKKSTIKQTQFFQTDMIKQNCKQQNGLLNTEQIILGSQTNIKYKTSQHLNSIKFLNFKEDCINDKINLKNIHKTSKNSEQFKFEDLQGRTQLENQIYSNRQIRQKLFQSFQESPKYYNYIYKQIFEQVKCGIILVNQNSIIQYSNKFAQKIINNVESKQNKPFLKALQINEFSQKKLLEVQRLGINVIKQKSNQTFMQSSQFIEEAYKTQQSKVLVEAELQLIVKKMLSKLNFQRQMIKPIKAIKTNILENMSIQISAQYINEQKYCIITLTKDNTEKINILQRQTENKIFQSISHELGTCVNILSQFVSSAIFDEMVSEYTKTNYLKVIEINTFFIKQIVQDIRDFQAYKNGVLKVVWKEHDLGQIILEVCQYFSKIAELKQIQFHYEIQDLPKKIYIDNKKVQSIVVNLLSNAFKFSRKNSQIYAKIKYFSELDIIKLKVKDNGIGMTQEEQTKLQLLLDGYNLGEKISKNSSGFGFGITLANILISLMLKNKNISPDKKGLKFKSQSQNGSSFWFYIHANVEEQTINNQQNIEFHNNIQIQQQLEQIDENNQYLNLQKPQKFDVNKKYYFIIKLNKKKQQINSLIFNEQQIIILNNEEILEKDIIERLGEEYSSKLSIVDFIEENNQNDGQNNNLYLQTKSKSSNEYNPSIGENQEKRIHQISKLKWNDSIKKNVSKPNFKMFYRQSCTFQITNQLQNKVNLDNLDEQIFVEGNINPFPNPKPKHFMSQSLIMIVDDEPMNIYSLSILIKIKAGVNQNCIITAYDGIEAIQKYKEKYQQIKMIFMDINMPLQDGFESTKEIRNFEISQNIQKTNIIGYSSYSDIENRLQCQLAGMDNFYTKPINSNDLLTVLGKYYFIQQENK